MIPEHARAILIVRLSARGDVALASPLARALRLARPRAHIAWAAEERTAELIRHNPHLNEVIVWERAAWKDLLKRGRWNALAWAATEFAEDLRSRRFDVVVDAQGLLRSGMVAFLSGAPVRIGLGSREGSRILMTKVVRRGGNRRKISWEYACLASALGLDTGSFAMEIPCGSDELAAAKRMMRDAGLEGGFLAACPFTTRSFKHWSEDRWSEVLGRLPRLSGLGVALLGGPADRAAADRILAAVGRVPAVPPIADLVGRTSLGEASALVSLARALVGVDTGLSHMAHAHGTPAVLLFGSNTPYLDPPGPDVAVLHSGRPCSPCKGKLVCAGRIDCMTDLTVDQVLAAVEQRLASSGTTPSTAPAEHRSCASR